MIKAIETAYKGYRFRSRLEARWAVFYDSPYLFCICPWCGKLGLEFDGRSARICGYRVHGLTEDAALEIVKSQGHWRADDKCYNSDHPRIREAARKAMGARFEHGETPK